MALDSAPPRSRRAILVTGLGGLAALAAQALGRPQSVRAGVDGDVVLGAANAATAATNIANAANDVNVFEAVSTHGGIGVHGVSATNSGVFGLTTSTTEGGVVGVNTGGGPGVAGSATGGSASGVLGVVTGDGTGVRGMNDGHGSGVWGSNSFAGPGVSGTATAGGTGGLFMAPTGGYALRAVGRTRFSRSGRVAVLAGLSTRPVAMDGVTTSSYILATLQVDRPGVYVRSVVPTAGSFTIHLNKAVTNSTMVGFLVIN